MTQKRRATTGEQNRDIFKTGRPHVAVRFCLCRRERDADVPGLPLGQKTKNRIAAAVQMGKLKLFSLAFDLRSVELFDDVYTLVEFKKTLK